MGWFISQRGHAIVTALSLLMLGAIGGKMWADSKRRPPPAPIVHNHYDLRTSLTLNYSINLGDLDERVTGDGGDEPDPSIDELVARSGFERIDTFQDYHTTLLDGDTLLFLYDNNKQSVGMAFLLYEATKDLVTKPRLLAYDIRTMTSEEADIAGTDLGIGEAPLWALYGGGAEQHRGSSFNTPQEYQDAQIAIKMALLRFQSTSTMPI